MQLALAALALATVVLVMQANFLLGGNVGFGLHPAVFVVTKILLVPSVGLLWYQITTDFDYRVVAFIFFCWFGDVCLFARIHASLLQWSIAFAGSIGFLLAHCLMISYFSIAWSSVPFWAPLFAVPCAWTCLKFLPRLRCSGVSQKFAFLYYVVLHATFVCSILRASVYRVLHPSYLSCALGYFFLVTSDSFLLARDFFVTDKQRRCETMLTYAIGQVLIAVGCGLSKWNFPSDDSRKS
jgi:uncharacterized membrane protein YhhN